MKVKVPESQNRTNRAGALTENGRNFLLDLGNYYLEALSWSSLKLAEK